MIKYISSILLTVVLMTVPLFAQLDEQEVRQRLDLIHSGKIDQVRKEISSLLQQLPNDPGVKYLEAYVTENGDQAVKKYQLFVDNFPQSVWADDALYKVYQYYYAVGLYKTADAKIAQLNDQYPNSIYAKRNGKEPVKTEIPPTAQPEQQSAVQQTGAAGISETNVPAVSNGIFAVQVGVYSQEVAALEQANNFTSVVGKKAVVFAKLSGGKTVYAVAFEGFADEQAARTFGSELKSKFNLDWFVVKR
jgi:tetratricopeptide (TPR) repeat protein